MINKFTKNQKGTMAMVLGSINYALYPVIISIAVFGDFLPKPNGFEWRFFLWGLVLVAIKELFNLFFQLLYMSLKNMPSEKGWKNKLLSPFKSIHFLYKDIFKNKLSNRYGWMVVFAAFLAGPMGYSIQTTGVLLAGPSIGTLLIALLPIWILLFSKMMNKEKKFTWITVVLSLAITTFVISNGVGQYFTSSSVEQNNIFIGLICGIVTGILWSMENVIMTFVSKKKAWTHDSIVTIKLTSSAVIIPVLLIPVVGAWSSSIGDSYNWYSMCFENKEWFLWLISIGFIMFLARWLYFYSIKNTSSIISSLTLVTRFAWIPFFQLIAFSIVDKSQHIHWAIFIPLAVLTWVTTFMLFAYQNKLEKKK